jgi:outer membrane autotransporter protein
MHGRFRKVLFSSASLIALSVVGPAMAATQDINGSDANVVGDPAATPGITFTTDHVANVTAGVNITGTVTAGTTNFGTLLFQGNSTVTGAVGANGGNLVKAITANTTGTTVNFGSTVDISGNVTTTGTANVAITGAANVGGSVILGGAGNITLTGGGAVTGDVLNANASSGQGNLSLGAATAITGTVGNGTKALNGVAIANAGNNTVAGATYNVTGTAFSSNGTLSFTQAGATAVTTNIVANTTGCGTVRFDSAGTTTFTGSIGNTTNAVAGVVLGAAQTANVSGSVYTTGGATIGATGTLNITGNLTGGAAYTAAGTLVVGGNMTGATAFAGNDGTLTLSGAATPGAVTATTNDKGTLNVLGNSTLSTVGNGTNNIKAVNLNGTNVTLGGNIYSVNTNINNGSTVTLSGNVTMASDSATASAVTLTGGTLVLGGNVLTINNGGGTTTLSTAANSTLNLTIGSSSNGKIAGNSTVNINGGGKLTINPTVSGKKVNNGDIFVVIGSTGTLTSNANVTLGSAANTTLLTWTLGTATGANDAYNVATNNGKDTILTATVKSASSVISSASSGAQAAITGLTGYSGTNTGLVNLQSKVYALSSASQVASAGEQLRPEANGASSQAAFSATTGALNVVGQRNDNVRTAQNGGRGINSGEALKGLGIWGEGFGAFGDQGTRLGVDGYSATTGGVAMGVDAKVATAVRAGVAFSYARTTVDGKGTNASNTTDIDSYQGTLYASYTGKPWYVNGAVAVGLHQYDSSRVVAFTGFSDTAKGSHDGMQYTAKVDAGYPIALGKAVVTPVAGVTYSYLTQDSFTETSTSSAALAVDKQNNTSIKSQLGAKVSTTYNVGTNTLTPELRASWLHEFKDEAVDTIARYAGAPGGTSFTTAGLKPATESAVIGLGATLATKNNLSLSANYDAEIRDEYIGHTGTLQVRTEF